MLEDLQIRRYSPTTIRLYLYAIRAFSKHFGKPPDQLGAEHVRRYQLFLTKEKKVSTSTYVLMVCALRFFYTHTLHRKVAIERIPFPRRERKLPLILSREEVKALLEAPRNLRQRTMLAVCTVPDLGSRKLPNSKRTTSTAHATCSGSAVAKDGRIDRLCCRPNCWNYCATIGEPGGPQAGFFPPPIPPGPSRPKPCSWLAGKRGERRAFLNLLIRTCCSMPSLHILLRPVAEQDLDGAGAAKTPSFFRCASSATAAARSSCGNCAQPSATEPCASPANFDPWLLPRIRGPL